MAALIKGYTETWYELCNEEGHPLAIPNGSNSFLTEALAAAAAGDVCVQYRDTVTVVEHTTVVKRIFHANINAVEA